MRKIEQEMVQAIRKQKDWSKDNTIVAFTPTHCYIYLHQHCIACFDRNAKSWTFQHCGYVTMTTTSRLRSITQVFTNGRVNIKKGCMYETTVSGNRKEIPAIAFFPCK